MRKAYLFKCSYRDRLQSRRWYEELTHRGYDRSESCQSCMVRILKSRQKRIGRQLKRLNNTPTPQRFQQIFECYKDPYVGHLICCLIAVLMPQPDIILCHRKILHGSIGWACLNSPNISVMHFVSSPPPSSWLMASAPKEILAMSFALCTDLIVLVV